jgi:hypothetical protein
LMASLASQLGLPAGNRINWLRASQPDQRKQKASTLR